MVHSSENVFERVIRIHDDRIRRKRTLFKTALAEIHERILRRAAAGHLCARYAVEPFRLGIPVYQLDQCVRYVSKKLSKAGFVVMRLSHNAVDVEWKHVKDLKPADPSAAPEPPDADLLRDAFAGLSRLHRSL